MSLSTKTAFGSAAAVAAAAVMGATVPMQASADWQPQQPIEFIIQTSPGGGSDVYARNWIGLIEKYSLSPQPVIPVNRPGGAGAVALTFMAEQRGNPHYISPTLNSIMATALQQEIPVMYPSEDLTPLVKMMMDPFFLVVNPANIDSWEDFLAKCQDDRLTSVGTGSRTEDEIHITIIQQATPCERFRYVPAAGGGDVAAQVAGGHADFNVNQPAEMLPHYPERLIPIVYFARERHPSFPDLPTHWELDINGEWGDLLDLETGLHQMRGVIGAADIPEEAVRFYEEMFWAVWQTEEWQDFMEAGAMQPVFMRSEEYTEFMRAFEDNHVRVMRDIAGWELRPDLRERQ